jgi:anti-sigma factor ChrR (cupin superfamily)
MSDVRSFRQKMYKELEERNKVKKLALENCLKAVTNNKPNEVVFISKDQLRTLNIGEKVKLSDGVEFYKEKEDANEMLFYTIMLDGGVFNLHYHDCIEVCKVVEGVMFETQRGDVPHLRVYKKGDRAIYDVGEKHSLYATEYTLLEVRFLEKL